jgi:hypothetical protein
MLVEKFIEAREFAAVRIAVAIPVGITIAVIVVPVTIASIHVAIMIPVGVIIAIAIRITIPVRIIVAIRIAVPIGIAIVIRVAISVTIVARIFAPLKPLFPAHKLIRIRFNRLANPRMILQKSFQVRMSVKILATIDQRRVLTQFKADIAVIVQELIEAPQLLPGNVVLLRHRTALLRRTHLRVRRNAQPKQTRKGRYRQQVFPKMQSFAFHSLPPTSCGELAIGTRKANPVPMKSAITEVAKIQQLARWKFPPAGEHLRNFDTAPTFSSYSPKFSALQDKPEEKIWARCRSIPKLRWLAVRIIEGFPAGSFELICRQSSNRSPAHRSPVDRALSGHDFLP